VKIVLEIAFSMSSWTLLGRVGKHLDVYPSAQG